MKQILISSIAILFSFINSMAQKHSIDNYIKELKHPVENLPEKVFLIPVNYGCDDCNNKIISFYKKNVKNKNILFIFAAHSNKLMKIYIDKHIGKNFEMAHNINTILDVNYSAQKHNLIGAFPKLYIKKSNYNGVELDNTNMSTLLR